jgi:hypothetical protein
MLARFKSGWVSMLKQDNLLDLILVGLNLWSINSSLYLNRSNELKNQTNSSKLARKKDGMMHS